MKNVFAALLIPALLSAGALSGRRAPSFALPDSKLQYHDILDYRGKIVLLDIMQTACPHCQAFTATLEKMKAKYGDKVVVLSIVNPPDNTNTVAQFIARNKVTTPILFDCGQTGAIYMKVTPANPSIELPHLFVIDQQGMIREDYGHTPATKSIFEGDGLSPVIDKLLAGSAAPPKK